MTLDLIDVARMWNSYNKPATHHTPHTTHRLSAWSCTVVKSQNTLPQSRGLRFVPGHVVTWSHGHVVSSLAGCQQAGVELAWICCSYAACHQHKNTRCFLHFAVGSQVFIPLHDAWGALRRGSPRFVEIYSEIMYLKWHRTMHLILWHDICTVKPLNRPTTDPILKRSV